MRTHITGPNMKSFNRVGMRVKGIQKTESNKSLKERFSKNTLVIVRIHLFWARVKITKTFPTTDRRNIKLKSGILASNWKPLLIPVTFDVFAV